MNNKRAHQADVFNHPAIVEYYEFLASHYGLADAERALIARYCAPNTRVLTIGCGTGRESFALHRQGFSVVGMDAARKMLETAMKKRSSLQSETLAFHQGDAVHLPYKTESFDHAVMLSQLIQHIPRRRFRQQALREVFRVLKPGGCVILSVCNTALSLLYLILLARHERHAARRTNQVRLSGLIQRATGVLDASNSPILRGLSRLWKRIAWECHPVIWRYSDPLPVGYHALFTAYCRLINLHRNVRAYLSRHPERFLEPNDFLLRIPGFQPYLFPNSAGVFAHFPDVDEMLADMATAGFTVLEYRSLEELQQNIVVPDTRRRSQRLIFYVAQKP